MFHVFCILLVIQILVGRTIGARRFDSLSDGPLPAGRWAYIVRRDEEPAMFWIMISVQVVIVLGVYAIPSRTGITLPLPGEF